MNHQLKMSVVQFCKEIGTDRLLVQGAGGNVSWKDGDTLWVKASGTWLSDAESKDIFVPVDLHHLQSALVNEHFDVIPKINGESRLKPSIETLLHALMPQKVVVHLHAVEILAHLVRQNCQADIKNLLGNDVQWELIEYKKPGSDLARAVGATLKNAPSTNVVFLKNHGVVIGGEHVEEVRFILSNLTSTLRVSNMAPTEPEISQDKYTKTLEHYEAFPDHEVQQLALNASLFHRLKDNWALYPDHIVFLGHKAIVYTGLIDFIDQYQIAKTHPELIFVLGQGVYINSVADKAKNAQLRCYYDVLVRQSPSQMLDVLTEEQTYTLLNWDAEHYRKAMTR